MTHLLVDTQIAVWWLTGDKRLTTRLQTWITTADAAYLSSASTWEVAIKVSIGKLTLDLGPSASFADECAADGFVLTEVEHGDAWAVRDLPPGRGDPFDRLIAATARRRGWTVASADPVFDGLDVALIRP